MDFQGPAWRAGSYLAMGVGAVLFLICLIGTGYVTISETQDCTQDSKILAAMKEVATDEDKAGKLRVVSAGPKEIRLGGNICVVAAGVASEAQAQAAAKVATGPKAIPITLFLNRKPLETKAKVNARPAYEPQLLYYDLDRLNDADKSASDTRFWRDLIAGNVDCGGLSLALKRACHVAFSVSIARSAAEGPETAPSAEHALQLRLYVVWILIVGLAAAVFLTAGFMLRAASSRLLRDHGEISGGKAVGTYSLGRTQMALWLCLSVAGFMFLWLTLGLYINVISAGVLVLLGINGVTGLAAIAIDRTPAGAPAPPKASTRGFLSDIICSDGGPQLHRIQIVIWTCILALIFLWNVFYNFMFIDFDTNLLLLMGIASSTYLGFKAQEK